MSTTGEQSEPLAGAYLDAAAHLALVREEAIRRTEDAMRQAPGWQAAAKAAAAHAVFEALRGEYDAVVTRLVEAHLRAGDRDAGVVAASVRERFVGTWTAPGLQFFPDSGPDVAVLSVFAVRHAADFEAFRERLAGNIEERVRGAADSSPRPPQGSDRAPSRAKGWRDNSILFAFLVVTALLSLAGVSWLGIVRWVVGTS